MSEFLSSGELAYDLRAQMGASASPTAIHRFDHEPWPGLVRRLPAQGAVADALGVARCGARGSPEAARRVAAACARAN